VTVTNRLIIVYGHIIVIGFTAAIVTNSIAGGILAATVCSLVAALAIVRG